MCVVEACFLFLRKFWLCIICATSLACVFPSPPVGFYLRQVSAASWDVVVDGCCTQPQIGPLCILPDCASFLTWPGLDKQLWMA